MDYKKWMFFRVLRLARRMKANGSTKQERWHKLFWFRAGLFEGIVLYERG